MVNRLEQAADLAEEVRRSGADPCGSAPTCST